MFLLNIMKWCHVKYYSSASGSSLRSTGNTHTSIAVAYNIQGERKMVGEKSIFSTSEVLRLLRLESRVTCFPSNHNEANFKTAQGTKVLKNFPEKQGHNQILPTTSARNVKPEGRPLQLQLIVRREQTTNERKQASELFVLNQTWS